AGRANPARPRLGRWCHRLPCRAPRGKVRQHDYLAGIGGSQQLSPETTTPYLFPVFKRAAIFCIYSGFVHISSPKPRPDFIFRYIRVSRSTALASPFGITAHAAAFIEGASYSVSKT